MPKVTRWPRRQTRRTKCPSTRSAIFLSSGAPQTTSRAAARVLRWDRLLQAAPPTATRPGLHAHRYDDFDHVGYDLDGKKIMRATRKDELDALIQRFDDPNAARTVHRTNRSDRVPTGRKKAPQIQDKHDEIAIKALHRPYDRGKHYQEGRSSNQYRSRPFAHARGVQQTRAEQIGKAITPHQAK